MDIAIRDQLRPSADVVGHNQVTVWRINTLTGTHGQINQSRFCDRSNREFWWSRGFGARSFVFAFVQQRKTRTIDFGFQFSVFTAADAHNSQAGSGDRLLQMVPVYRRLKAADVDDHRRMGKKCGRLRNFVF